MWYDDILLRQGICHRTGASWGQGGEGGRGISQRSGLVLVISISQFGRIVVLLIHLSPLWSDILQYRRDDQTSIYLQKKNTKQKPTTKQTTQQYKNKIKHKKNWNIWNIIPKQDRIIEKILKFISFSQVTKCILMQVCFDSNLGSPNNLILKCFTISLSFFFIVSSSIYHAWKLHCLILIHTDT